MPTYAIQKSASLRDQVVEAVQQLLQAGIYTPGQRMTEEGLVQRLEVSRTPIREALGQLVHRGVLQARPGGGYLVPIPTESELQETIFVRMLLEPAAIRMAAEEFGPEQFAAIDQAIQGEQNACSERNPLRFAQANEAFRVAVFGAISNRTLRDAIAQFNSHLQFIRSSTLKDLGLRKKIVERQSSVRDAVAAHDADLAEALWKSYLRLTEDSLLAALSAFVNEAEAIRPARTRKTTDGSTSRLRPAKKVSSV